MTNLASGYHLGRRHGFDTKGATKLRSTVVKPHLMPAVSDHNGQFQGPCSMKAPSPQESATFHLVSVSRIDLDVDNSIPTITKQYLQLLTDDARFAASRGIEFNRLIERCVLNLAPSSHTFRFRNYGACFLNEVKNAGKPSAYENSRFVVQSYNNSNPRLLTHASTVHRVSQKFI